MADIIFIIENPSASFPSESAEYKGIYYMLSKMRFIFEREIEYQLGFWKKGIRSGTIGTGPTWVLDNLLQLKSAHHGWSKNLLYTHQYASRTSSCDQETFRILLIDLSRLWSNFIRWRWGLHIWLICSTDSISFSPSLKFYR